MKDAINLLKTRRSPRIPDLTEPAPSEAELETLLTIASRVPDHGKLAPWRFLVLSKQGRASLADSLAACFRADHPEATPDQIEKEVSRFRDSPLVVGVVSRAAPHVKIPEWEQVLSAGAACMNLVTAAHALGYGANWVTGWAAYDRRCLDLLKIAPDERVAGFIHIGTPIAALEDRPRPKLDEIVTRL
ncbi:MAG: nitroreductase [Bradyrhizobiaceae bacterium]|nr:nitroreductase [Bradyrhizobiaceae bacterium]